MSVLACPVCGTPTQRTPEGTPLDGLREHQLTVHPTQPAVEPILHPSQRPLP